MGEGALDHIRLIAVLLGHIHRHIHIRHHQNKWLARLNIAHKIGKQMWGGNDTAQPKYTLSSSASLSTLLKPNLFHQLSKTNHVLTIYFLSSKTLLLKAKADSDVRYGTF